jgi:aminoglycoside phosphotransferase (APT) family kinase protein
MVVYSMDEKKDQDTISVREGEDFDRQSFQRYLTHHVGGWSVEEALKVTQFTTGFSNLTYLIRSGENETVMRRPPFGPLPPKAHDMKREYQLLEKLHPVFPYVPKPYFFCEDESVIGARFYLMERKKGVIIDEDFPLGYKATEKVCKRISYAVVDALAELHQIDYKEVGLSDFGYPKGFLERQVNGWIKRYERSKTDEIDVVDHLSKWLLNHIPDSQEATIIHNDYKLNNMLFSKDFSRVEAILDWEMATVADPLFDLAGALGYWVEENDSGLLKNAGISSVTTKPGFISRNEFIERYAKKTGRDILSLHFYMTFVYFWLAVVLQQIYFRWKTGQTNDERFSTLNDKVKNLMNYAYEVAETGKY